MIYPSGTRVRVKSDWPELRGPCHIRTPYYVRGEAGTVERYLGDFPNPEDLAFARQAAHLPLYHVRFDQPAFWRQGQAGDEVLLEIYAHWLEAE